MMMCKRSLECVHMSGGKMPGVKLAMPVRCNGLIVRAHASLTHPNLLPRLSSRFFDISRFCVMWRIDGRNVGPMHRITEK